MRDWQTSTRAQAKRHIWIVAGIVAWVFLAIEGFRPWPDRDELVPLMGQVESHEISQAVLYFTIPDSSKVFKVHAGSHENWYAIVEAAELKQEFTIWVGPAVAAGRIWPLSSFAGGVPWQLDADGGTLVSLEAERDRRRSGRWFLRVVFLLLSGLGYLTWKRSGRAEAEEEAEEEAAPESEELEADDETDRSVDLAAVWGWSIIGVGFLGLGLWAFQRERYQANFPIPERGDLVEHTGEVSGVKVKVSSDPDRPDEVLSTSFGLEGVEGRWVIYKNLWKYDTLARRLVPGARARILVTGNEWERTHGAPPRGEALWEVEVGDELILPLDEQLSVVRNRRENKTHPFLLALLPLVGAAFIGNAYRHWLRARA